MVIATPLSHPQPAASPEGGRLVSTSGRTLPLERTEIRAESGGGLARTILVQHFQNPHPEALRVTYKLPLPADGAVGGFSFRIGDELVEGEVDRKQAARERFERAIVEGRTAALVEQERSSLFTQEVGNIPPGETVICQTIIDHPLKWLNEGAWEYRFPTVVGARYMGSEAQTPDAKDLAVDVSAEKMAARLHLDLRIADELAAGAGRLESPSHAVELRQSPEGQVVGFRRGAPVRLDRDVVVRWPVAKLEVGVQLGVMRRAGDTKEQGFGLLTIVPPVPEARTRPVARDLIFLIDTSGSMSGQPLEQATSIAAAMIDTLHDEDRIEVIEFSNAPRPYAPAPVLATAQNKKAVIKWLKALQASGSTEMETAIRRAIDPLRKGAQRQVVLITDGYIGFEERVVKYVLDELPRSCRVHTVGVGSAVNRTLTQGVARAGGGVEVVLGVDEDAERPAARLLARTADPVVIEVDVRGPGVTQVVPVRLPDLYAGAPALIPVRLDAQGGEVVVRGRTADGPFEARVPYDPIPANFGNGALAKLFAREWVEDLETYRMVASDPNDTDDQIEAVGLEFQIATRKTSWVAVSRSRRVAQDLGQRTEEVPQEIPHGVSIAGFGLRQVSAAPALTRFGMAPAGSARSRAAMAPPIVSKEALSFDEADEPTYEEESGDDMLGMAEDGALEDAVTGEGFSPLRAEEPPEALYGATPEPPPAPAAAPADRDRPASAGPVVEKRRAGGAPASPPPPREERTEKATLGGAPSSAGAAPQRTASRARRVLLLLLLVAAAVLLGWLLARAFGGTAPASGPAAESSGAPARSAPAPRAVLGEVR